MILPEKEYLTINELTEKWGCPESDLFHLIATGKLTPSLVFNGNFSSGNVLTLPDGSLFLDDDYDSNTGMDKVHFVHGVFFLNKILMERSNKCASEYFSKKRNPNESDYCYQSPKKIELEFNRVTNKVESGDDVVFVPEEILRCKREHLHAADEAVQSARQSEVEIDLLRQQLADAQKTIKDLREIAGDGSGTALHNTHLMKIAIDVQKKYFSDPNNSQKQETLLNEIEEFYKLSAVEARAVERVACPIDRKKNISPLG